MAYTLNNFFRMNDNGNSAARVLVFPNHTVAAQLVNHLKEKGAKVLYVAECISSSEARLPMPNVLMSAMDEKISTVGCRVIVVGIDAYLALLKTENISIFMSELRTRLDAGRINADYLISSNQKLGLTSRYEESRKVIYIAGDEETPLPFHVLAYPDKWTKPSDKAGYQELLRQTGQFLPSGTHSLILADEAMGQAGLGRSISFVTSIRDIAVQRYGINADLDDHTLECLLSGATQNGQSPESFLASRFGEGNCTVRLALKRLLELQHDPAWQAYVWFVKRRLPGSSYIARVLSKNVTSDTLLREYAVGTAVTVISDTNAAHFSAERAEGLTALTNYEPLIVEFIGLTRELGGALQFLNCGTLSECVEIVRRASREDLSHGLPQQYGVLFPALSDYFSSSFDYDSADIAAYFSEYRRLKAADAITEEFSKKAFDTVVPNVYPTRESILDKYREQSDTALLVIDGMGVEYMPLLISMSERHNLNMEFYTVATANIPTETELNPIQWDGRRIIPEIRRVDDIVHDGAVKHEVCTPERNLVATLQAFEVDVMNRIAEGLACFPRLVVTADHGASRLAVIARRDGKGRTLPWNKQRDGEPLDWRYSIAPKGVQRPEEYESGYFPTSGITYWVTRGYNRLPKEGGKKNELHGGASLEERLVPVLVFTKSAVSVTPPKPIKKPVADLKDEFEGLI